MSGILGLRLHWHYPEVMVLFGGPNNYDCHLLGSIWGPPISGSYHVGPPGTQFPFFLGRFVSIYQTGARCMPWILDACLPSTADNPVRNQDPDNNLKPELLTETIHHHDNLSLAI